MQASQNMKKETSNTKAKSAQTSLQKKCFSFFISIVPDQVSGSHDIVAAHIHAVTSKMFFSSEEFEQSIRFYSRYNKTRTHHNEAFR